MHVFRVGALSNALVLADVVVAYLVAFPSSRSSGDVATPWVFAHTPIKRLKH
jgi:hypothetical protein